MSAVKFLRLEDFLDNERHGMALHLEPQGILFAEVHKLIWMWAVSILYIYDRVRGFLLYQFTVQSGHSYHDLPAYL